METETFQQKNYFFMSTAQNININPSPSTINNQLASQQLLNRAQANFR